MRYVMWGCGLALLLSGCSSGAGTITVTPASTVPAPTATSAPVVVAPAGQLAPPVATVQRAAAPESICGPSSRAAPLPAEPSTLEADWLVRGGWFFTQAGGARDRGFAIVDDDDGQLWSEFQRLGGWRALGYPASRRFMWRGVLSQATQRTVLQWSPVTGQVEFANILDLLHEVGRDDDLRVLKQIPSPGEVDEVGLAYEAIAARRLAWMDSRPAIKAKYCNFAGGADPVQLWGLPTSRPIDMSGGGQVYVLRTQRAAFQEWVNGAEWAAPGEVTVVLAGDLAKEFDFLPAEALVPESAPGR
jgi:hypothetical protein